MKIIILILFINFYLMDSKTKYSVIDNNYIKVDSLTLLVLKDIEKDSNFIFLQNKLKNHLLRKINKDDTLNLELEFNNLINIDVLTTVIFISYENEKKFVFVDSTIINGYLPDSCFVNKKYQE